LQSSFDIVHLFNISTIKLFFLPHQNTMRNITEDNLVDAVLERLNCDSERDHEILSKFIKHIHAFVKDLEPTEEEWSKAINFLTRTGQACNDKRQEFILLSDVLGVSMLVDAINHRNKKDVTETTVTGPFHTAAMNFEMGANIARGDEGKRGEHTIVRGKILDENNQPVSNATIDVWQSDDIGSYDIQDTIQPEMNLRGVFKTDETGTFWFKTIKPAAYSVPTDGPVGELLRAAGRQPMRPAHIHFWIKADGFQQLITHLFVAGDEHLDSDAVFGVKESLILDFKLVDSKEDADKWQVKSPFYEVVYNFKLAKEVA